MGSDKHQRHTTILEDEAVVFFPTFAHYDLATAKWKVRVHGWIFDERSRSRWSHLTFRLICRMAGITRTMTTTPIFQQRARPFLVNTRGGKRLAVRIGSEVITLSKSSGAGHFEGTVFLTDEQLKSLIDGQQQEGQLPITAVTRPEDVRDFGGSVRLIPRNGLSVISDIDDTIKHSQVADRRRLLANTFLHDFKAVPGMADLYQKWADQGAAFHYVSASPWQLYEPLSNFLDDQGFPDGTFHLKFFRPKSVGVWRLFSSPRKVKGRVIEEILTSFPQRKFVFVGDSGQHDPEIYGRMAREYPEQLGAVLIRNVNGESERSLRMKKAFDGLPPSTWALFDHPEELNQLALPSPEKPPGSSAEAIALGPQS